MLGIDKKVRNEILYLMATRVPVSVVMLKAVVRYLQGLDKEDNKHKRGVWHMV
jgi:hypothetical protein